MGQRAKVCLAFGLGQLCLPSGVVDTEREESWDWHWQECVTCHVADVGVEVRLYSSGILQFNLSYESETVSVFRVLLFSCTLVTKPEVFGPNRPFSVSTFGVFGECPCKPVYIVGRVLACLDYLSVSIFVCLSICLSISQFVCLSSCSLSDLFFFHMFSTMNNSVICVFPC